MQEEHQQILVLDSLSYSSASPVQSVSKDLLCVNNSKSSCNILTALTHLVDILAVLWETKNRQCGKPADGTFLLTLMGSLSRMLDQGLSLPVVVETPN